MPVGRERKNQAIVALAVRTSPSAVTRSVFVSVANLDLERRQPAARAVGRRPAASRSATSRSIPRPAPTSSSTTCRATSARVEVRLVGTDPAVTAAPDQLAVDDRAWAIIPPDRTRLILVVGEGDPYLETALSYLPDVELFGVTPAEYGPETERTDGRPWDLVIFEGFLPATLPRTPILAIAPPRTSPLGEVSRHARRTRASARSIPDEPILRYVDLSTTHIAEARKLDHARLGADRHPGAARRAAAVRGRARRACTTAVLAFEPRRSDLPLQVAFPILLANLTGELLGVVDRADRGRRAGDAGRAGHPARARSG